MTMARTRVMLCETILQVHIESTGRPVLPESEREIMNACEKGTTKAADDVVQRLERQQRERYTRGSKNETLGELR